MREFLNTHTRYVLLGNEIKHSQRMSIRTPQIRRSLWEAVIWYDVALFIDTQRPLEAHVEVDGALTEARLHVSACSRILCILRHLQLEPGTGLHNMSVYLPLQRHFRVFINLIYILK